MEQQKNLECKVERITNGPKHHLFGFHDLLISNKAETKYLCLEVDTINRPPLPGEMFGVGYVEDGCFIKIGETTALNYPQGARQQWVADSDCFTVNNRVGESWGTDLYDSTTNKLLERYPATTHMLSKDGKLAFGLDYARLFRLGGYGYSGIEDNYKGCMLPSNSGITVMNMHTKEVKLLVSVRKAAECDNTNIRTDTPHYLTHLCLNPSSTRIAFLHRYVMADGGIMTRLMTIGIDGSCMRCLAQGFLSHFDWKDDDHIYIFGRANSSIDALRNNRFLSSPIMVGPMKFAKKIVKQVIRQNRRSGITLGKSFIMIKDSATPELRPFAQNTIYEDGHPMTNPIRRDWCVNDTYPNSDGKRTLMLYHFPTSKRLDLGCFKMLDEKPDMTMQNVYFTNVDPFVFSVTTPEALAFTRSGLHCDLHPRWSRDGRYAVFDSIHEGSRQIYRINVSSELYG